MKKQIQTTYDSSKANSFILTGRPYKRLVCFNEEKPIKITGPIEDNGDGTAKMNCYSGEAIFDGEKWVYTSDYAKLADIIINRK
jgi:hypothetical protein